MGQKRRYRRVSVSIWADERFRPLSDRAKLLMLHVLTHPSMTSLGAMRASAEGLAADLDWTPPDLWNALNVLIGARMVTYDAAARLLTLPNFLKHNPPENPNVVKSWASQLELLPESRLRDQLVTRVRNSVAALPPEFASALPEPFRKGSGNPSRTVSERAPTRRRRGHETLSEPFRVSEPNPKPDPEQEPYSKPEHDPDMTGREAPGAEMSVAPNRGHGEDDGAPTLPLAAPTLPLAAPVLVKAFIARFCDLYCEHRGVPYDVKRTTDVPHVRHLLRTYPADLLETMAEELQRTTDSWIAGTDRGLGILRLKSNWLAAQLSERERQGRMDAEDDALEQRLGPPTFDCPTCGGIHEAVRIATGYDTACPLQPRPSPSTAPEAP